jgi:hypothetical protein
MTKVSSFVERGVIEAKQHRETHVQESFINFLVDHFTCRINFFANPWETWQFLQNQCRASDATLQHDIPSCSLCWRSQEPADRLSKWEVCETAVVKMLNNYLRH